MTAALITAAVLVGGLAVFVAGVALGAARLNARRRREQQLPPDVLARLRNPKE